MDCINIQYKSESDCVYSITHLSAFVTKSTSDINRIMTTLTQTTDKVILYRSTEFDVVIGVAVKTHIVKYMRL